MCVIAAFFARVLQMCSGRPDTGFLLICQEVREICKTRNQSQRRSEINFIPSAFVVDYEDTDGSVFHSIRPRNLA